VTAKKDEKKKIWRAPFWWDKFSCGLVGWLGNHNMAFQQHEQDEHQVKQSWKSMISPTYWKSNVSVLWNERVNVGLPSWETVSKASETISRQVKESAKELGGLFSAEEDCLQATSSSVKKAPWEVLTPKEKPFAKEIEEKVLHMTRECYQSKKQREETFLSLSSLHTNFGWCNDAEKMSQAMAALEKDPILADLRAGLVPKKMSEDNFWRQYFYLVEKVKKSVVNNSQFGLLDEWENWDNSVDTTSHPTVELQSAEDSDLDKEVDQVLNEI